MKRSPPALCPLIVMAVCCGPDALIAAESPHSFSANMTIASDYLYRGISQTSEQPAVQGGLDYSYAPLGLYLGTWASNVDFAKSSEIDIYGGIAGEFANGLSWDVGGLYYMYPGSGAQPEENFVEAYVNAGYAFDYAFEPQLAAGLAYSPDFFGEDGNAVYVYGSISVSLPQDFGAVLYVGYQDVAGDKTSPGGLDYTHYRIAVSKRFETFEIAASWNDADSGCGGAICKALVASISASF